MGKVIAVTSGEGETGKTTTVAAVSACLASLGYKTLCVDFDTETKSLTSALNMDGIGETDLSDAQSGPGGVTDKCACHPEIPNLFLLSPPASFTLEDFSAENIIQLYSIINREFDYCLVDAPSGAGSGCRQVHAGADMSVIVTSDELPIMADVRKATITTAGMGAADIRLLVNRIQPQKRKFLQALVEELIETVGIRLIGLIPESDEPLRISSDYFKPELYNKQRKRRMADHFYDVAMRITDKDVPWILQLRKPITLKVATDKLPSRLISIYGDPATWAHSTLPPYDSENLTRIFEITQGIYASREMIRQRMWLHDALDDVGIQYHVEFIGRWATRKKFVEAQHIYVKEEFRDAAKTLIKEYNNAANFIADEPVESYEADGAADKVPQKDCPSCGSKIDFDYFKCPYCGSTLDDIVSVKRKE